MQRALWLFLLLISGVCGADEGQDLRAYLEGLDAGAEMTIEHRVLLSPGPLKKYYQDSHHQAVWTGSPAAESRLAGLVSAIKSSERHGFSPSKYHLEALTNIHTSVLGKEILASDAFFTQVKHRTVGAVSPQSIDPDWDLPTEEIDLDQSLHTAISLADIADYLDRLWPHNEEYWKLLGRRVEIASTASLEMEIVPAGPALKPGQSDWRVALLKQRLYGPGDYSLEFDGRLTTAVKAFQYAAGLDDDGVVGSATLEVLNASRSSWIDRIDANLERWRWLPAEIPDTYIRVNIAAFQLRVMKQNREIVKMPVIVGRSYRRTPVFANFMRYLVFNPYWNVPYSIATKDKLPLLKKDSLALESLGYEIKSPDSDDFVSVSTVDWLSVQPKQFNYLLRQKPGPMNALGQIKFMLPNAHSVYLHDTPDKHLFAKQERGFSSGCIRLSDPKGLAVWILENDGQGLSIEEINQQLNSGETKTHYLNKPLPVLIIYFTAFTDEQGEVIFRRDLYQRDQAIVDALRGET